MRIIQIHLVLAFMLLLNGCAIFGIDMTETRTIAIQKDPYIIVLDGDIDHKDWEATHKILAFLSTQQYIKADNTNFAVHITDQTVINKGTVMTENISSSDTRSSQITVDPQNARVE